MTLPMTLDADIAATRKRLATAESERTTWRLSGMQEKYLESCSMVDALELQLNRLEKVALEAALTGERSTQKNAVDL